jgi:hypothetical protein
VLQTDGRTDDSTKSIGHIFQKCALKTEFTKLDAIKSVRMTKSVEQNSICNMILGQQKQNNNLQVIPKAALNSSIDNIVKFNPNPG